MNNRTINIHEPTKVKKESLNKMNLNSKTNAFRIRFQNYLHRIFKNADLTLEEFQRIESQENKYKHLRNPWEQI